LSFLAPNIASELEPDFLSAFNFGRAGALSFLALNLFLKPELDLNVFFGQSSLWKLFPYKRKMFNLEIYPTLITYLQSVAIANIYYSGFYNDLNMYVITGLQVWKSVEKSIL
jgi:hypothetical protein